MFNEVILLFLLDYVTCSKFTLLVRHFLSSCTFVSFPRGYEIYQTRKTVIEHKEKEESCQGESQNILKYCQSLLTIVSLRKQICTLVPFD